MVKSHVVFAALLIFVLFLGGCSLVGSGSVESPQIEESRPQSALTEPDEFSDAQDDSVDIVSADIEPSVSESIETDVPQADSVNVTENESVVSIQADADEVEPDIAVAKESNAQEAYQVGVEPEESVSDNEKLRPAAAFYDKCADILKSYVDDRGMVDYKNLRRKRLELRAVLREFNSLDPKEYESWPMPEKIAFWINVYNLQKLNIVTDNYPITPASRFHILYYWSPSSIRHIETRITRHKFLVMDEEFTFAEIERQFFRREFNDPRIFFAITAGCLSSPPLRNEPYYGYKLDEQLDDQTKKFLSNPLAFKIDRQQEKVYLSALFQISSYGGEFIEKFAIDKKFKEQSPTTRAVLNFISNYISKRDVSFLEVGNYNIMYMSYDWTINDGS